MKRHSIAGAVPNNALMNETVLSTMVGSEFPLDKNRKEVGHIMKNVDGFLKTFQAKRNSIEPTHQGRLLSPLDRHDKNFTAVEDAKPSSCRDDENFQH